MKKIATLILASLLWASPVSARDFTTHTIPLTIPESSLLDKNYKKELRCLALNIYHEARGSTEEDRFGVALVTINRVASDKYKNTICTVVWQKWKNKPQFGWTTKPHIIRNKIDMNAWDNAQKIAYTVLVDKNYYDMTEGSICFFQNRVKLPKWMGKDTKLIGAHLYTPDC